MNIAEVLLDTAVEDNRLLIAIQDQGDDLTKPRDLDFFLYAKTKERATLVADFITDNRYGRPFVQSYPKNDESLTWRIKVTIHAPLAENVVHTLSAFFACLSQIYDLDYDGWETSIEK
ncbi:MAG: ribonuclease E inhibitor RraB [Acidobacteria bacterium]|nr:ribonuclease E inhibitor RraB [Acidobacteriota bacterium]